MSNIQLLKGGINKMNCSTYCSPVRGFFTKKERIEMLKDYKESLDMESKGVSERINELEESED